MTQLPLIAHVRRVPAGTPLVAVRVPCEPMPFARPRARGLMKGGKPIAQVYDAPEYDEYLDLVAGKLRVWARDFGVVVCPAVGAVTAVFPRPAKRPRSFTCCHRSLSYPWEWTDGRNPCVNEVDLDNLVKSTWDATVRSGLLLDDRLVVEDGGSRKVYAAVGEAPCLEVRLWVA